MSRFLGPRAFGIGAFVVLIYTALGIVVDTGVTSSVARSRALSKATLSRLHVLSLSLAVVGCAVLGLCRGPIAEFLTSDSVSRSDLASYELALIVPILAMAAQAVPRGLLIRRHQFKRLAYADLASVMISYGAALILGYRDRGSASPLVLQLVLMGLCRGVFITVAAGWLPTGVSSSETGQWREQWHFLRKNWLYSLSTFASRNVDNYLVSRTLGVVALGFYSRAFSLFLAPFTQLQYSLANIMLRNFAFDQCPDDATARMRYARLFSALGVISVVLSAVLLIGARPVVLVLFGDRWLPSVPLVRAFSLALLTQLLLSPGLWFIQARGPSRALAYLGYLNLLPLVGVVVGGLIGSLSAVAVGYATSAIAGNLLLGLVVICRLSSLDARTHWTAIKPGLQAGLIAAPASAFVVAATSDPLLTTALLVVVLLIAVVSKRRDVTGALASS